MMYPRYWSLNPQGGNVCCWSMLGFNRSRAKEHRFSHRFELIYHSAVGACVLCELLFHQQPILFIVAIVLLRQHHHPRGSERRYQGWTDFLYLLSWEDLTGAAKKADSFIKFQSACRHGAQDGILSCELPQHGTMFARIVLHRSFEQTLIRKCSELLQTWKFPDQHSRWEGNGQDSENNLGYE